MSELWEALVRLLQRLEPLEQTLHLPPLEIEPIGDTNAFWAALKKIEDRIVELETPAHVMEVSQETNEESQESQPNGD